MSPDQIILQIDLPRPCFHLRVNVTLPGRGITAVFGPSGCGKTTLLRAIAGLEDAVVRRADSRIQVNGVEWLSSTERLPTWRRRVGYVFQEACLFEHLSVQQNLLYGFKRNQPAQAAFDELVQLLDLAPLLLRHTTNLSGGERQRIALARALLASPALLLMDEPLAALDQERKQEIVPYLERLQQHLAIPMIYVSHALDEVVQLADHLLLMENGTLVGEGPVSDLLHGHAVLAQRDDAFALIEGRVTAQEPEHHLTVITAGDATFYLPQLPAAPGQTVRLRVYARDVSLCLDYPQRTSILNILPARISRIQGGIGGQNLVHLDLAGQILLARISHRSCCQLELVEGQPVYAQIKALALMK